METAVTPVGSARGPARALVSICCLSAAACGDAPTEPANLELPDGEYVVTMANPVIVNPLTTPSWMGWDLAIEFTKAGDGLTVTGSTMDLVVLGPSQLFEPRAASWGAQFAWRGRLDGEHYWEVELTAEECLSAAAVDEDLGIGPGGVWTVPLRSCGLVAR